ncbi:hypothetical protein KI387_019693, partial [Taxus chinensis]
HGPRRYREIVRVVFPDIQDTDTITGYMEAIQGLFYMVQIGHPLSGAETQQSGQGSQARDFR